MKITAVEPVFVDRYLFVEIHTDEGIVGLGESGAHAFLSASAEIVKTYAEYLVGEDPLKIEHHWQYLYRWMHFRGAAIMGALSAIDIALWDIAGKHHGVPVYQLLGGPTRDKARVYRHVFGASREALVEGCLQAKAEGYTAVGHLTPFADESRSEPFSKTYSQRIAEGIESVRQYREALGDEVDLCIEIHRQLTPAEAIALGRGIAEFRPMFIEDPIPPDNIDEMAHVARHLDIPIATGERLHTIYEFEMLLARDAVQFVRPDVCLCGGLSGAKKIAALAEARYVGVIPHNPLSPVSTAACLQLAAAIPNFAIQEYAGDEHVAPKSEMVVGAPVCEDGYTSLPEGPGIGVSLAEGAAANHPYWTRELVTRVHRDGSVVDQ